MSVSRVVIVVEIESAVIAAAVDVESPADASRLRYELSNREVLDEIRQALAVVWDDLSVKARGAR